MRKKETMNKPKRVVLGEPLIHSHITDVLPKKHPLANEQVYCDFKGCKEMLHAFNNECMQTWVETANGNFCTKHFKLKPILE